MKKICYLADASNSHTQKSCVYFRDHGYDVSVISLNGGKIDGVKVYDLGVDVEKNKNKKIINKLGYIGQLSKVKRLIKKIKPDILHSQYASSYGLLGALSGFHPYMITIWGSDIYDFPKGGFIQKNIIKYNFKKSDYIFANSKDMAREGRKYTSKYIQPVYLGVDLEIFKPSEEKNKYNESCFTEEIQKKDSYKMNELTEDIQKKDSYKMNELTEDIQKENSYKVSEFYKNIQQENSYNKKYFEEENYKKKDFVIGVIKSLEKKYGIEYLIEAFALLKKEGYKNIKLKIGGSGTARESLENYAKELGLGNDVEFLGRVPFEKVASTFSSFDVSVFPSLWEGFGVASIESQACGTPVIVTNVGGHPESMNDGVTGLLVEPKNAIEIKEAVKKLIENDELRKNMSCNAVDFVRKNYELNINFKPIEKVYNKC
ncbi:MAG: glycosyltransferase [Clostridioides sp.]|jgi:glycosyltransferase involved in cell wall biosynthesis|nr:glycosyltransferase [Clostridioides sp.]